MNHKRTLREQCLLLWLIMTRLFTLGQFGMDILGFNRRPRYQLRMRAGALFNVRSGSQDAKQAFMVCCANEYPDSVISGLPPNAIVIDVGAHIGSFAVHAKRMRPDISLYALEPAVENFDMLKQNILINNISNPFEAAQLAMTNCEGHADLSRSGAPDSWRIVKGTGSPNTQTICCTTLASFMRHHRLTSVNLLKLDAEGSEHEILDSSFAPLAPAVENIFVECHSRHAEDSTESAQKAITAQLNSLGYSVRMHNDHVLHACYEHREIPKSA
jgi:FkbM family methyltransferase